MFMKRFSKKELSPLTRRRLQNFKSNRRGYYSFWIFISLLVITMPAEFIANDKPLLLKYKGEFYFPVLIDYQESVFGGFLAKTDYRDPFIEEEIHATPESLFRPSGSAGGQADDLERPLALALQGLDPFAGQQRLDGRPRALLLAADILRISQ